MKALEKPWAAYELALELEADRVFHADILPFLKKRGWHLLSGNGTWVWVDPSKTSNKAQYASPEDREFQEVEDLLSQEVPGFGGYGLGQWMPCWEGGEVTPLQEGVCGGSECHEPVLYRDSGPVVLCGHCKETE